MNQNGAASPLPKADAGWSGEIALDLDMASAICPGCKILLVEANSASMTDLGAAVNQAVKQGATVVSNSYGGGESTSNRSFDTSYFNHPGVAIFASSGHAVAAVARRREDGDARVVEVRAVVGVSPEHSPPP